MADYELTPDRMATAIGWREQGFSAGQVAELCTAAGWSPIETIKVLKEYFGVGIGEGKTMVDRLLDPATRKVNDYLRFQAGSALPADVYVSNYQATGDPLSRRPM